MQRLFSGDRRSIARMVAVAVGFFAAVTSAHSNGVAAPIVAEVAIDPAVSATPEMFRLIEHGGWMAATQNALFERRHMISEPIKARIATARPIRPRRTSSPARDRVIVQIHAAERRHGLPIGLLDALVAAESGYRPHAVSSAGAAGLGQLMPATARSLGVFDRFDVRANLDGAARYLRLMIDRFGSVATALAAYNAGPGAVIRAGGIPRNRETPTYVSRVLQHWRLRASA